MNNEMNSYTEYPGNDCIERDQLIYDVLLDNHYFMIESSRDLDNKAINILGFVGIILGLVLLIVTSGIKKSMTNWETYLFILSLLSLAITLLFCINSLWLRDRSIGFNSKNFMTEYVEKFETREYILGRLSRQLAKSNDINCSVANKKSRSLRYSFLTFFTAIVFTFIFIVYYLLY